MDLIDPSIEVELNYPKESGEIVKYDTDSIIENESQLEECEPYLESSDQRFPDEDEHYHNRSELNYQDESEFILTSKDIGIPQLNTFINQTEITENKLDVQSTLIEISDLNVSDSDNFCEEDDNLGEKDEIVSPICELNVEYLDESLDDDQYEYVTYNNEEDISIDKEHYLIDVKPNNKELFNKSDDNFSRIYACDLCPSTFQKKSCLTQHKLIHSGDKKFKCPVCEYKCARNSYLKIHLRIHTNQKPYVCSECGKGFVKSGDLSRHRLVHSDIKKFQCSDCSRMFKRLTDLTSHMRVHTGEKPYACHLCDKSYSSHSSRKKHFKTHEPAEIITNE